MLPEALRLVETSKTKSAQLYIRHAESVGNLLRLTTSSRMIPLSPSGVRKARRLRDYASKILLAGDWHLYSSSMARSVQTMKAITGNNHRIIIDSRLNETNGGVASNVPRILFDVFYPTFFEKQKALGTPYPGGESHLDMVKRVASFLMEKSTLRNLFACTHHGTIAAIIYSHFNDILPCSFEELNLAHGIENLDGLVSVGERGSPPRERKLYSLRTQYESYSIKRYSS